MTSPAWTFLVAAIIAAAVDWVAVVRDDPRTERFAKPAVIVALILVVFTLRSDVPAAVPWVFVALVASLLGDVFLLPGGRFRPGLAAFLVAHLAYIVAFVQRPLDVVGAIVGIVGVALLYAFVGRRILAAAMAGDRSLGVAVGAYLAAISAMAVVGTATLVPFAVAGAWLFVASDAVLGWTRFVGPIRGSGREAPAVALAIIVPYHAAQVLLVLSFAI